MVTDAPLAAAHPFLDIEHKVGAFLTTAKVIARDGLTWTEFGSLLVALLRLCVETLDATASISGHEKKLIAIAAVASLFDLIAGSCVPLVAWPAWAILRPALRAFVLALASGALESLLPLVRSTK
jgi:hypothetical protein